MTLARPMFPPVDPTRRRFINIAAGASVASVGTLALAGISTAVDPAFALIAAHRAAEVAHCKVIDAHDEAEARYGIRSDEAWEAADGGKLKRSGNTGERGWKWRARFRALRGTACPKAITIPHTIRMNAGRCSRTGAKQSRNSCLLPRRTLRRSPGKKRPWPPANINSPM